MGFWEVSQCNTGGEFVQTDTLCHVMIVEADSEEEAKNRLENVGVDFCSDDGSYGAYDTCGCCPCCGHRWYPSINEVELGREYGRFLKREESMQVNTIEDYAEWQLDGIAWTSPEVRVFYRDGSVKEFFGKERG